MTLASGFSPSRSSILPSRLSPIQSGRRPTCAVPTWLLACVAVSAAGALGACESKPRAETPAADASTGSLERTGEVTAETLDERMVVGPAAARTLGYRIDWETSGIIGPNSTVNQFSVQGDAVMVLDTRNLLSRIRVEDGRRVWQAPVGSAIDRMLSITRLTTPEWDRVFVPTEGTMFVVDASNGAQLEKHKFNRIANTAAAEAGRFFVFGGRTGEVVWHELRVGQVWKINALDGSIRVPPVIVGNDIAVVSSVGEVAVMDARSAQSIWRKRLLSSISARPAAGNGMLFVAGEDQYLWAMRLADGQTVWKYFNDAPLRTGPFLLEDLLFQRIPSEGLVAFDAFVTDRPDGRKVWVNKDVTGEVIGRKGTKFLVWDETNRVLSTLDRRGATVDRIPLPQVEILKVTAPIDGDLYAASADGRLVRLVPQ